MLEVCSLWVGGEIPPHLAACIESFVSKGHPFTLYAYGNADAPKGVTRADGEDILGLTFAKEFLKARKFSQLSNYFRYELLAKRPGVCWVDVDMYCLRPLNAAPYIFGWEDEISINGAVLAIPPDSELLTALRAMFLNPNFVAPWLTMPRFWHSIRIQISSRRSISRWTRRAGAKKRPTKRDSRGF